jgi:hypothetical protein
VSLSQPSLVSECEPLWKVNRLRKIEQATAQANRRGSCEEQIQSGRRPSSGQGGPPESPTHLERLSGDKTVLDRQVIEPLKSSDDFGAVLVLVLARLIFCLGLNQARPPGLEGFRAHAPRALTFICGFLGGRCGLTYRLSRSA